MKSRLLSFAAVLALAVPATLGGLACATAERNTHERLYFAMELRSGGRLVGKPKLLGESGKLLKVERKTPGSDVPDYHMELLPKAEGDHYAIQLDVQVPDGSKDAHSELAMLHGEVKKVQLGKKPGELEMELLMMRVDSPEFRALMGLPDGTERGPNAI